MRNSRLLPYPIFVILVLAACGSATPAPAALTPTSLPTPTPPAASQTPAPTFEPTDIPVSPFRSFPGIGCCRGKAIEAGHYELPAWFGVPLTLEVGEGWSVLNEAGARLFLLAGGGRNEFDDPSQVLVFIAIPEGDPQAVLTSIQGSQELTSAGEITATTIAGLPGWQFDAAAKPNPENEGSRQNSVPPGAQPLPAIGKYFAPGFLWTTWTAEPRMRFIALTVDDAVLLLEIESPPAEFDAFAGQVDRVLQTLALQR